MKAFFRISSKSLLVLGLEWYASDESIEVSKCRV